MPMIVPVGPIFCCSPGHAQPGSAADVQDGVTGSDGQLLDQVSRQCWKVRVRWSYRSAWSR